MPWTHCELPNVPDSDPCPTCRTTKAEWTVKLEHTKKLQVNMKARPKQARKKAWVELSLELGPLVKVQVEAPTGVVEQRELDDQGLLRVEGDFGQGEWRVRFAEAVSWVGVDGEAGDDDARALHAADVGGWIPCEGDRAHAFVASTDLVSIRQALVQDNGSPVDLFGRDPAPATVWARMSAERPLAGLREEKVSDNAVVADPEDEVFNNPIWSWSLHGPGPDGALVVSDLCARVRETRFAQFTVADRLEWSPLEVEASGGKLRLPFEPAYFLEGVRVADGANPGTALSHHAWKLPARLDQSFRLVFGYEVDGGAVRPLEQDERWGPVLERRLFPGCPAPAPAGTPARGANPVHEGVPLRLVVVATLMCNRERNDFEPGGVMGAGRFYPIVQLLSNHDLAGATHTLSLTRPARTHRAAGGFGGEGASDCCEEMHATIGPVLFTDTNEKRLFDIVDPAAQLWGADAVDEDGGATWVVKRLGEDYTPEQVYSLLPIWNNFFDYYDLDPAPDDHFQAVTLHGKGTTGQPLLVESLRFPTIEMTPTLPPIPLVQRGPEYMRMPVTKVQRQGEFDSVHMAPKMFLDPDTLGLPRNTARFASPPQAGAPPPGGWKAWGLDRVSMAPFCVHDCLHTHWRWSVLYGKPQNRGWAGFDPYALPGAPLVPGNQSVHVSLPSDVPLPDGKRGKGQVEKVRVARVEAGRWQVLHHQGSGYPLGLTLPKMIRTGRLGMHAQAFMLEEPEVTWKEMPVLMPDIPVSTVASWTFFYWRLRFGGTKTQPMERLKVSAELRAELRKHGL